MVTTTKTTTKTRKATVSAKAPATKKPTAKARTVEPAEKSVTKKTAATKAETVTSAAKKVTKTKTTKSVAAKQLTLVDALPVAVEPPAAVAPAPKKSEPEKAAPAPTPAPQVPIPAAVEETPRRAEDMGPERVRAALHLEHNSRGRGRSEAEKRESYARYRANKKLAMQLETRNTRYLILFPASDADTNAEKFYNMAGNSAIIYCHEIGPRLKRKPVLRRDMDLGPDRFHSGVCSVVRGGVVSGCSSTDY